VDNAGSGVEIAVHPILSVCPTYATQLCHEIEIITNKMCNKPQKQSPISTSPRCFLRICATSVRPASRNAHASAAENVAIIISCTCICVHAASAGLQGSYETVEESIRQPCSGLAQPVTNPWPLEPTCVGFLLEFFACAHMGGRQLFSYEIGMLLTHLIRIMVISYLDQSALFCRHFWGNFFVLKRA
jgi:hypothetical protein